MLKEQHIMPRSKEIQEHTSNKIVDMYQSGKGYKAISKALGLQNYSKSATTIHPGGHKRTQNNI